MSKFEVQSAEDKELFELFKNRPAGEDTAMQTATTEYVDVEPEVVETVDRAALVKVAAGVAGRVSAGCLFLGAISRGWVEPLFGLAASAVFFILAWAYTRRY